MTEFRHGSSSSAFELESLSVAELKEEDICAWKAREKAEGDALLVERLSDRA